MKTKKPVRKATVKTARKPTAKRTKSVKNSNLSTPAQWLIDWACAGGSSTAGETVNSNTALGISAYLACIKNISEDVAKLPLGIYRALEPRGSELLSQHPTTKVIRYASNEEMSAMSCRETITAHALGWKGGFAEIVRDGAGALQAMYPLDPDCVQVLRENGGEKRLYYKVHGIDFSARDIFHIHGLGKDGLTGYVLAAIASQSLGTTLAAQKFSGAFFGNGTTTTGVIEVPEAMTEIALKNLRESFALRHSGAENQHRPIILEDGATWKPSANSTRDSQMIETLFYGVEDVCRLFRMPPHKIQHLARSTNNNIEQQALEYVQDALLGWLVRWEQEIWRKLLLPRERVGLFAKHNVNMLLRGDMAARSTFYREGFNIGYLSINDIRDKEDMNPIDGGDAHFVNATMVPLEMAATGEHLKQKQTPQPANPAPQEKKPSARMVTALIANTKRDHKRAMLARLAETHKTTIVEELTRIMHVEHDSVTTALGKPDGASRIEKFYGKTHKSDIKKRLGPLLKSLRASLDGVLAA